jgi:predicted ThiF/HesA family dinucleotide-utilizing enzyme
MGLFGIRREKCIICEMEVADYPHTAELQLSEGKEKRAVT